MSLEVYTLLTVVNNRIDENKIRNEILDRTLKFSCIESYQNINRLKKCEKGYPASSTTL